MSQPLDYRNDVTARLGEPTHDDPNAVVCTLFELASALADLGLDNDEATTVATDLLASGRVRLLATGPGGRWLC